VQQWGALVTVMKEGGIRVKAAECLIFMLRTQFLQACLVLLIKIMLFSVSHMSLDSDWGHIHLGSSSTSR
jgi:hypothetical protein